MVAGPREPHRGAPRLGQNYSQGGLVVLLVFIDYATCYPEAIPLQAVTALQITEELIEWITQVGIPKEILTDQGWNFMSGEL